jgi:hypothetical protein
LVEHIRKYCLGRKCATPEMRNGLLEQKAG